MTGDDRKRARELCERATKAPWWICEDDGSICAGPDGPDAVEVGPTDFNAADTEYVCAASPTTVLALLDEIERLQDLLVATIEQRDVASAERYALRDEAEGLRKSRDGWHAQACKDATQLSTMTASRDALRAALEEACEIAERNEKALHDLDDECVCYAHPPLGLRVNELRKLLDDKEQG